jgi:hypothetical protein
MAVITAASDTTTVADSTNSEWIDAVTRAAAKRPYVWMELVSIVGLADKKTDTYTHVIRDNFVQATAHTDSDEVTAVETTRTDTNTTTAEYASASFVADRAIRLSIHDELAWAVMSNVEACMLKLDNLVLALATSMTGIGSAATPHTVSNFNTAIATWKATAFGAMSTPIMVMHTDAMRDLADDSLTNAAAIYGSVVGEQLHNATNGVNMGTLRQFGGVYLLETTGIPASDTTGWGNFIVSVGEQDGGLVVPVGMDIRTEVERVGSRIGGWVVASMEVGAGIVEAARCLRFTTRT